LDFVCPPFAQCAMRFIEIFLSFEKIQITEVHVL